MNRKKEDNESENKKRILVACVHSDVRQELIRVINGGSNFVVCGEAENANQALETIEKQQVDLAIVDTSPQNVTCAQVVEEIKLRHPNLPVLTIPMREFLNG